MPDVLPDGVLSRN